MGMAFPMTGVGGAVPSPAPVASSTPVLTLASLMLRRCDCSRPLIPLRSDTTRLSGGGMPPVGGVDAEGGGSAGESGRPSEPGNIARVCELVDIEACSMLLE